MPDCSRGSVATIPASTSVAAAPSPARGGENFEGWGPVVTFDPMKDLRHGEALCRSGMEQGREERAGTLCPVVLPRARDVPDAARRDHCIGGHDGGVPTRGGRQRRPSHAFHAGWAFHFAARVVEERPSLAAARRRRGAHDVGLRRRRDDGAFREQNIGYDQGRCLPGPWRTEHQRRALRARPHPTVCSLSNIDAVARETVDLTQCSSGNQARIVPVDIFMSALFHTRDVCVGRQISPWDILRKVSTTAPRSPRASAACASIIRLQWRQSKVVYERKMTARIKNA